MTASRSLVRALTLVLVASINATPLGAQRRADLAVAPSLRVRVMASERPPGKVVGSFLGADSIAVHVIDPSTGVVTAVNWSTVRTVEVRTRRRSASTAFARGAKAGAITFGTLAVLGIAYAVAWDLNDGCLGVDYCIPATLVAIPMGYIGTVVGTALGGVAGLANRDRWETAWPPPRR